MANTFSPFVEAYLAGRQPSVTDFLTPGINPAAPDYRKQIPPTVSGTQPPQGAFGKIDKFLGTPGGGFLLNLLAQSGYSPMPDSPFGAIGRAGLMTAQQQRQRSQDDLQKQLIESQIGLNKYRTSSEGQQKRIVQSAQPLANGNIGYINAFTGEIVDTGVKAGGKGQIIDMLGIGQVEYNPVEGTLTQVNPEDVIRSGAAARAGAVQAAKEQEVTAAIPDRVQTQEQAEAVTELPKAAGKAANAISVLDQMSSHPGLPGAVGFKGASMLFGGLNNPIPGTPEADFMALVKQASGAVFLEAFQELKGGGHITEIEGQKAEQAVARIGDTNQSEKAYKEAILELKGIINRGLERKQRAAGGNFAPTKRYNPETGQIEDI